MNFRDHFAKRFEMHDGVFHQIDLTSTFPESYFDLRKMEGRRYSDEAVIQLPEVGHLIPHGLEWRQRKSSSLRLMKYFSTSQQLSILDVGCGNGWLTRKLAMQGHEVCGVDVVLDELTQAARIAPNATFVCGDIFSSAFDGLHVDKIVLAASIQYFPSVEKIIHRLVELLTASGEIHVFDSPIYTKQEVSAARKRSESYFEKAGQSDMINHYFHHCWDDFESFNREVRYAPYKPMLLKLFQSAVKTDSPFPWIVIRKDR